MNKKDDKDLLISARKGLVEQKRYFKNDDDIRSSSSTLLKPDDVAGDYDFSRSLKTMLGGKLRALTVDDLKQFSYLANKHQNKFKKGITAQGIIDFSLPQDINKTNSEIKTAVPITSKGNQIRFMTNASGKNGRDRHYVVVNFLNFEPAVASGIDNNKAGKMLVKSPLQISCSCGRWRFWFAYLATKGNYNSGHREDAFPKVRNPTLSGIACKHALRVAVLINQSPFMKTYLANMVDKARQRTTDKIEYEKLKNVRLAAEEIKKNSWRQRTAKTTDEKRAERNRWNAANAAKKAPPPKRPRKASTISANDAAKALAASGLSMEQIMALIKSQQG